MSIKPKVTRKPPSSPATRKPAPFIRSGTDFPESEPLRELALLVADIIEPHLGKLNARNTELVLPGIPRKDTADLHACLAKLDHVLQERRNRALGMGISARIGKKDFRIHIAKSKDGSSKAQTSTYTITVRWTNSPRRRTKPEFDQPIENLIVRSHPESGNRTLQDIFQTGLLVIAGQTGSGKTTLCKGLITDLIGPAKGEKGVTKRSSILMIEDPPEILAKLEADHSCARVIQLGFDVIQRESPYDATLPGALQDALRQTPFLVYVGEVREPEHWTLLLRFARTGHRVITTCHAGSVRECLTALVDSQKPNTPEERAVLVDSLFGIIHVKAFSTSSRTSQPSKTILPSCWWATRLARAQFACYGQSSLVPSSVSTQHPHYLISRSHFAKHAKRVKRRSTIVRLAIASDLFES
jgi:energy-coupling factor transporter ATP-binding protein EcfA2